MPSTAAGATEAVAGAPTPPVAERRPTRRTVHGVELSDDYAWLRDPQWQQVMRDPSVLQPDIRAYLEAENAYTEAALAGTGALRETLFAELKGRIKEHDDSVPDPDGPWEYFVRFVAGGDYPLLVRRPTGAADGAGEEVLLDGNREAEGHPFFALGGASHSRDHRHLAYAVDLNGSEFFEIRVLDMASGSLLPDRIASASGSLAWAADGETLFYTRLDDHHRPCQVLRHRLGGDPAEDVLVYEEKDPGFFLGVALTDSRELILIDSHDHATSEIRLLDAWRPAGEPLLVAAREPDLRYSIQHDAPRDRLLILTNLDGAEDFKLMAAPLAAPGRSSWRDLLPHEPGTLRLGMECFREHLVLLERVDALPRLTVLRLADGASHRIGFEEAAYSLGIDPSAAYDTTALRFVYSSPTTPAQTYAYDLESRERSLLKEQEVPSGHDAAAYRVERFHALAEDGEEIPVTLLHRADTPLDGSAPVLLYGYGAYGIAVPANFVTNRFSLVDRGFVYVIAHIRGGMDKGWRWYRNGKLEQKTNSFDDFVAVARSLIARGLARKGEISIMGGSAGGLLVGAVLNRAPELFKAAVADVPFVDTLNTMLDETLPLTPPEWPEWGNPITDAEAFARIRGYSPYDNVGRHGYPHLLVTAGLTDPRVTYWEPAKWVAKLRALKTDDQLLLLRTYMEAGHGGASGRFDKLKEVALTYAFLLEVFGRA
ncbi:oligopeptidase B Serine peptidase. MEROPS family S09A [Tistlia consotensis]|uniref:Oligopeptidase B Serine peptidase. MEROPS family S09A n=1 Tax=Tistlia consotensis USBA 355 TaxID=560819 RepID=A0A1Y6BEN8_9PROT|nr:S9 family peptidase [Tistlia consotensis]SMF07467.1 oligopeptidase B Serine peptidase. MEROPS family S09A [Tistlia consotensis USBA 355]SNR35873.1 oligopeptidase B Serine peptidase. MEROPS family S09A [Tistlia consotensis]